MQEIISSIIAFLIMLNPFAMFLYLAPVMKELSTGDFRTVLLKATVISFGIFALFLLLGDFLFNNMFRIDFESFRIFGGIVIFSFAYFYIVKGQKALVHMKETLDDLASEIALPFMVGAGTISLTILMSHQFEMIEGFLSLIMILSLNFLIIVGLKAIKDNLPRVKYKVAFDKNMEVMLRLMGFFLGAIGINMIITGVRSLFF